MFGCFIYSIFESHLNIFADNLHYSIQITLLYYFKLFLMKQNIYYSSL